MAYTHVIHILNDLQLSPGDLVFLERSDRTKRFGEVLKGAGTHIHMHKDMHMGIALTCKPHTVFLRSPIMHMQAFMTVCSLDVSVCSLTILIVYRSQGIHAHMHTHTQA